MCSDSIHLYLKILDQLVLFLSISFVLLRNLYNGNFAVFKKTWTLQLQNYPCSFYGHKICHVGLTITKSFLWSLRLQIHPCGYSCSVVIIC